MGKFNEEDAPGGIAAGTVIDGRYKVVRGIGYGGNGLVHEVEHLLTGRHLALKSLLDESGLARLEQEARASALMRNGHTAKITDMGTTGPAGPYLVMELLEGQSLRELLDEAGQLPLELTVNMALQVCECLYEAHGHSIIHRDLKPENVFLCASPWPGQYDVKVLDFGIVKISSDGPIPKSSLTRTGSTVGTPYYMSLEQLRNSSAVDVRADVYSLGVVLYECLSGRKPFQADTIGDLVYALCSGPPTHLNRLRPDLPPDVCDVVMRTLSMNRDDRPATMADLATALVPHGNAAFGMWMRAGGPPVTAARPEPPKPGALTPSHIKGLGPAIQKRAPMGSATATEVSTSPPPEAALAEPAAPRPRPPRPVMDSEVSSERRDTPTEMYVKAQHGALEDAESSAPPPAAKDRDTPTRSYDPVGAPVDRTFLETMKSAGAPEQPSSPGVGLRKGSYGSEQGDDAPMASEAGWVPTRGSSSPALPTLSPRMAPGNPNLGFAPTQLQQMGQQNPMLSTMPITRPDLNATVQRAAEPGEKPGWQASLDRALNSSGRFVEDALRRFRAASQRAQLAIAIAVGGVVTVVVGLLLLWLFR